MNQADYIPNSLKFIKFAPMRRFLLILPVAMFLFFSSCNSDGKKATETKAGFFLDEKMVTIARLQDERNLDGLIPYLKAKKAAYRNRAAIAIGSIRDPKALPYLFLMLQTDNENKPRSSAAWAIGQIGDEQAIGDLLKVVSLELDYVILADIMEAIGKCANQDAVNFLRQFENADPILQAGHAAGIYRSVFRVGPDSVLIQRMFSYLMDGKDEHSDFYAANYLARSRAPYDLQTVIKIMKIFLTSPNENIRVALIRSLEESTLSELQLQEIINGGLSVPERKEIIRLLVSKKDPAYDVRKLLSEALEKWKTPDDGVNYTLLAFREAIDKGNTTLFNPDMKFPPVMELPDDEVIAMTHGMLLKRYDKSFTTYLQHAFNRVDDFNKVSVVKAMGTFWKNYDWLIEVAYSDSFHISVRYQAFDALFNLDLSACQCIKEQQNFFTLINDALRSGDMALQSLAAITIQSDKFINPYTPKDVSPLVMLLDSVIATKDLPRETETWFDLGKARAFLLNEPYNFTNPATKHPVDWNEVILIPESQQVRIKTNKGDIVLRCFVKDAPGSVWNFLKLVDEGFYNGKAFHRVVPNFVIQGGCPRGDGWGALDWSQRTELSPDRPFIAGAVGLASVGPDTEGVQFFITHIATPHLDGRYTVFAKVTEGMDVVQRVVVGDKIISITRD